MACKICGRESCTESFHSLEEQEEFETKTGRYEPTDICPICGDEKPVSDLHRNCGK